MFYPTRGLSLPVTLLVYLIAGVFLFWLDFISNVFTMGHFTPWPREVAILVVGATLLMLLYFSRRRISWLPASVILFHMGLVVVMWVVTYREMMEFERVR